MNRTQHANKFYFRSQLIKPITTAQTKPQLDITPSPVKVNKKFRINTFTNSDFFQQQKQQQKQKPKQKQASLSLPRVTSTRVRINGIIRSSSMEPYLLNTGVSENIQNTVHCQSSKDDESSLIDNESKYKNVIVQENKNRTEQNQYLNQQDNSQQQKTTQVNTKIKQDNIVLLKLIKKIQSVAKPDNIQAFANIIEFLTNNSPLFQNHSQYFIFQLLKWFKISYYTKDKWIYKKNETLTSFFIILNGKVKITNSDKTYKIVLEKGQCLCSELLFARYFDKNVRYQNAKAILDSYVLEINYEKYLSFNRNLTLKGFKAEILCFQNQIYFDKIKKDKQKGRVKDQGQIKQVQLGSNY